MGGRLQSWSASSSNKITISFFHYNHCGVWYLCGQREDAHMLCDLVSTLDLPFLWGFRHYMWSSPMGQ